MSESVGDVREYTGDNGDVDEYLVAVKWYSGDSGDVGEYVGDVG